MTEENYVVVLDADKNFCRLFRIDSVALPSGDVLWSGRGLRRGYDAMIRLNKDRRPIEIYSVCSSQSKNGRIIFKICKGQPEKEIAVLSTYSDYKLAREEIKRLTQERNAEERAEKEYSHAIMRRVGIQSSRIPKWTPSDLKYIAWLEATGKIAA